MGYSEQISRRILELKAGKRLEWADLAGEHMPVSKIHRRIYGETKWTADDLAHVAVKLGTSASVIMADAERLASESEAILHDFKRAI